MYHLGEGVRQDYAQSARWFLRAAEQGHADAQYHLGFMYYFGQGVAHDYAEAGKWFRRAAEQDYADAQFMLGTMHLLGRGIAEDYAEAGKWVRRAPIQGHVHAQYILGTMHHSGSGVAHDYAEAGKWFRRAAEQDYADAQYKLGVMYYLGRGIPQDYAEAAEWYRRAAEQGDADAQFSLGFMYLDGRGVLQDYAVAVEWFRRAAEQGDPDAPQFMLAALSRGRDVPLAPRLARDWRPEEVPGSPAPVQNPVDVGPSAPRDQLAKALTGSGFRVSASGHILTNAHVVRGCTEVRIPAAMPVRVVAYDDAADIALLESSSRSPDAVAAFRQGRGIRAGASVVVIGHPLHGILASEASVSAGIVSALAGPGDDRRLIQITAPVQPGNSGGPVLDSAGNVIGVVVATLHALQIARDTGYLPQNVNFAVAAGAARAFLDAEDVPYLTAPSDTPLAPDQAAAVGKQFTVLVECWKPRT